MKVMLLAAGVGERMRPLTNHTPKPLLEVGGMPLIDHHIRRLAAFGLNELVIYVSHLGQQIMDYCCDGERWGVSIAYSPESTPLETAGGIIKALKRLGDSPFMVVNGDVWTDYPFERLVGRALDADNNTAHLVFVDNPAQHPLGDYAIDASGTVCLKESEVMGYTYAGVGLYSPRFFSDQSQGKLPLRPLLDRAIEAGSVGGEYYAGEWVDVGTLERLKTLDETIKNASTQ
jgi:MurNAc alpha-1-phosphate uridylyltransferase